METSHQYEHQGLGAHEKALKLNLDQSVHGTFAEIGAGQEVARWFFHVGHASGTVAKTMSAYDMAVSDAIYGPTERYVSRARLDAMLDHEYSLLLERLDGKRGANTKFFAYANTVATRNSSRQMEGHGWMGIRLQAQPRSAPSDIVMHVKMYDSETIHEQEAVGLIGVNLIYAANYLRQDPSAVIGTLLDGLSRGRIEVDMIEFRGPAFSGVDNRFMSLDLVRQGLTEAVMFTATGDIVQPADILYKRRVLILRGSFRPVTNTIMDMVDSAKEQFSAAFPGSDDEPVVLFEMALNNLLGGSGIDPEDFLTRADILQTTGASVLVTNLAHYYSVATALSRYTSGFIGVVLGVPALAEIFKEKYYADLDGGILEAFGRLFRAHVRLFAYPFKNSADGVVTTVEKMRVPENLRHLFTHLVENGLIQPIKRWNEDRLEIFPSEVRRRIAEDDQGWESLVPESVARVIRERGYFGYRRKA
jgi:hypothetical protein